MRSQPRFVVIVVTILIGFSVYTIVRNIPASNFQLENNKVKTPFNQTEEVHESSYEDSILQYGIVKGPEWQPAKDSSSQAPGEKRSARPHLIDLLDSAAEVESFDFQACKMSNCFDYSRCNSSETLKVYIIPRSQQTTEILNTSGESTLIYRNIINIVKNSKYYEPNPDKACIFLLEDDTLDRDPLSSSFRPTVLDIFQAKHRFGLNHLVFNFYSGSWPDYKDHDFAGLKLGAAILSKASNSRTHHRRGFDISIPLFSHQHPIRDSQTDSSSEMTLNRSRPYFLTFKGKRYVLGSGSDTRNSLYHLNNERDVLMITTCRHGKKLREIKSARCDAEEQSYGRYDFFELMQNSTFCLTPRGRRLGSFRFLEALNHRCIPVVLSDGWVWPFDEIIDWSDAAVQFPENEILLVPDMLRDIDVERVGHMRDKCHRLYTSYFSSVEKIVMTTLSIIDHRIKNKLI